MPRLHSGYPKPLLMTTKPPSSLSALLQVRHIYSCKELKLIPYRKWRPGTSQKIDRRKKGRHQLSWLWRTHSPSCELDWLMYWTNCTACMFRGPAGSCTVFTPSWRGYRGQRQLGEHPSCWYEKSGNFKATFWLQGTQAANTQNPSKITADKINIVTNCVPINAKDYHIVTSYPPEFWLLRQPRRRNFQVETGGLSVILRFSSWRDGPLRRRMRKWRMIHTPRQEEVISKATARSRSTILPSRWWKESDRRRRGWWPEGFNRKSLFCILRLVSWWKQIFSNRKQKGS